MGVMSVLRASTSNFSARVQSCAYPHRSMVTCCRKLQVSSTHLIVLVVQPWNSEPPGRVGLLPGTRSFFFTCVQRPTCPIFRLLKSSQTKVVRLQPHMALQALRRFIILNWPCSPRSRSQFLCVGTASDLLESLKRKSHVCITRYPWYPSRELCTVRKKSGVYWPSLVRPSRAVQSVSFLFLQ